MVLCVRSFTTAGGDTIFGYPQLVATRGGGGGGGGGSCHFVVVILIYTYLYYFICQFLFTIQR